jgi:hypothetical protein
MPISAIGAEILPVSTTAVGITSTAGSVGFGALAAMITVEVAPIRWWANGSVPTAGAGHLAAAGSVISLGSRFEVRKFLAIRQGGSDALLHVTSFG